MGSGAPALWCEAVLTSAGCLKARTALMQAQREIFVNYFRHFQVCGRGLQRSIGGGDHGREPGLGGKSRALRRRKRGRSRWDRVQRHRGEHGVFLTWA